MNDDDDKGSKWQKSTISTITTAIVAHVSCIQDFIIIRHILRIATHNGGVGGWEKVLPRDFFLRCYFHSLNLLHFICDGSECVCG